MLEYKIITLPPEWVVAERILNENAKGGWRVICSINGNQVILERGK